MSATAALLSRMGAVSKAIRATPGAQIYSAQTKDLMRELASEYFSAVKPIIDQVSGESEALDSIFQELHAASHKNPTKKKCLDLLKAAKHSLVTCEGIALAKSSAQHAGHRTPVDESIVATLNEICPSASLAYQQALDDLNSETRQSWRGPATDLREALRETLDLLAPDGDVESSPGFKLEQDAKHPTMKQKVRYILRNRGAASGAIAPPENAVQGIEDMLGSITRSVYTRSSVSTHTPTDRAEVARVHAWVRLVLCELLELPL